MAVSQGDWTTPRPPAGAAITLDVGVSLGVAPEAVVAGTELRPEQLLQPGTQVTGLQQVQMVRNLRDALPRHEHLGLLIGKRYHSTTYGTVGFAMSCSASMVEVSQILARYHELTFSMVPIEREIIGDSLLRTLDPSALPSDLRDFYLQVVMAGSVNMCREVMGFDYQPDANTFTQPAPGSSEARAAFAEVFGPVIEFGAPATTTTSQLADMARPNPRHAPLQMPALMARCDEELARHRAATLTTTRVTDLIENHLDEGASVEQVARALLVSPRTLRRQLQAEGTTFRDVLESVRARVARELLQRPSITVAEVSSRLGYENPPAFTTAFRRWYGVTPTEFRQAA